LQAIKVLTRVGENTRHMPMRAKFMKLLSLPKLFNTSLSTSGNKMYPNSPTYTDASHNMEISTKR
jgi:hypothetical protein